jgi:hypothetical protein
MTPEQADDILSGMPKAGQRVRNRMSGRTGTIIEVHGGLRTADIRWDNSNPRWDSWYEVDRLDLLT